MDSASVEDWPAEIAKLPCLLLRSLPIGSCGLSLKEIRWVRHGMAVCMSADRLADFIRNCPMI
eukprot:2686700-Prorocentrum_lima.AAC.1